MANHPNLAARGAASASTPAPFPSEPPLREQCAGSLVGQLVGLGGSVSVPRSASADRGGSFCRRIADESHTGAATTKSEKAPIGQGRAHSSLALDDDGPRSGMGAVCWAVGAILCVAVFPALYLLIAACMGAL